MDTFRERLRLMHESIENEREKHGSSLEVRFGHAFTLAATREMMSAIDQGETDQAVMHAVPAAMAFALKNIVFAERNHSGRQMDRMTEDIQASLDKFSDSKH